MPATDTDYSASLRVQRYPMACADNCLYIQLFKRFNGRSTMESATTTSLMALGLLAGLMIGTGHIGGGLAVAVAAGAGLWMLRADSVRHDLR
jgi:hypothetical protein